MSERETSSVNFIAAGTRLLFFWVAVGMYAFREETALNSNIVCAGLWQH
jgi:hypothetical protein